MRRCSRCCLHKSMRIVNVIVNLFGIVMIIYSLWLLKKWVEGVAELSLSSPIPKPWFIYTCLGIGIVVNLSTILGHMVANCISRYTLALYIASICSLVLIQAWVITSIFFKIDWESQITKYIDEHNKRFKNFILFHLIMCRLISILALVAQINVAVLAFILWAVGGVPRLHCCISDPPDFTYSFLADYNSPVVDDPGPSETVLKFYMERMFSKSSRQLRRIGS